MRKLLLAILSVTLGLGSLAYAVCDSRVQTCLTALDVSGNASVGSLTNTGVTTFVGATAVSTLTVSGSQGFVLANSVDVNVTSPTVAWTIVRNSTGTVFISTGTGAISAWFKIGTQQ